MQDLTFVQLTQSLMNRVCDLYSEIVILLTDEDYREPKSKSPPPAGLGRLNRKMNESVIGKHFHMTGRKGYIRTHMENHLKRVR